MASRVKDPVPGFCGAEGCEKGKGVTVKWGLKEAQSRYAGRPFQGRLPEPGYEVRYTQDDRARDRKVLLPQVECAL
ncbi:MAG: hypothetical protein DKINENOH_01679 [bacterium]|nr:hypothetical protein [bacterium]